MSGRMVWNDDMGDYVFQQDPRPDVYRWDGSPMNDHDTGMLDLGGMGAYLPDEFKGMHPGSQVSPEAIQQILQTFAATDPQRGGARVFNERTPTTIEELVADPRSPIRMENGQYVFRPEESRGNWDYNVDRTNVFKGFLTSPGAMMATIPLALGALGQMGMIGNVAGTAGAAEFPTFMGDVASQAVGAAGSAAPFASSFNPTITPSTVAQAGSLAGNATGASMPSVAGLSGVGGLTAQGAAALAGMGQAGAGLGMGTTGAFGALDAAGSMAQANLASSAGGAVSAAPGFLDSARNAASAAKTGMDSLSTGSKLADSVIASTITGAIAGGGAQDDGLERLAQQQRADQQALDDRMGAGTSRINDAFGGYDDDYFSGVAKSYRDHFDKQVGEQSEEARRKIMLNWPGGPNTSGYARRMGNLTRDTERQFSDVASQSVDFANRHRGTIEDNRSNLMAQLQGGASAESVSSQAQSRAAAAATPPAYSPLGDLFARYTAIPANQVLARNQGFEPKPLRFSGGRNPVSVVA